MLPLLLPLPLPLMLLSLSPPPPSFFRRRLLIFSFDVNYLNGTHRPGINWHIFTIYTDRYKQHYDSDFGLIID